MGEVDLVDLEGAIKKLPDVLGCVILTHDGDATEIQAFTRSGSDTGAVQRSIIDEAKSRGVGEELRQVLVFELEAESIFGDRESLERAAELAEQEARSRGITWEPDPPLQHEPQTRDVTGHAFRPPLRRVVLSSSAWKTHAEVVLGDDEEHEVIGESSGDKTPHGLKVLSQATLDAVTNLVGSSDFLLEGASLVSVVGQEAVLVMLRLHDGLEVLGAALVREGPVSEAAVRATLDALNRRFARLA